MSRLIKERVGLRDISNPQVHIKTFVLQDLKTLKSNLITMNLKVTYSGGPNRIDEKVDRALEKALEAFRLHRWASGFNFIAQERDLAFTDEPTDGDR